MKMQAEKHNIKININSRIRISLENYAKGGKK